MPKLYAFIGNSYCSRPKFALSHKNNTYIPHDIDISRYDNFVNNHKNLRNQIPDTISNMDFLPLNTSNIPIIESVINSIRAHHNTIQRDLQNMAFGLFFLIFIRKRWHK